MEGDLCRSSGLTGLLEQGYLELVAKSSHVICGLEPIEFNSLLMFLYMHKCTGSMEMFFRATKEEGLGKGHLPSGIWHYRKVL